MQSFIKWMSILNIEENVYLDIENKIIEIDEDYIFEYNQSERKLFIYKINHKDNENISFNDYLNIWTVIKDFLIEIWIVNEKNKKDIFKIEKIFIEIDNWKPNIKELDSKIHKVPDNDIILLKTLSMLKFNIELKELSNWLVSNKISFNKNYVKEIEEQNLDKDKISFKLKIQSNNNVIEKIFIKTNEIEYIIFG